MANTSTLTKSANPWIHYLRITIGPLTGTEKDDTEGRTIQFESSGDRNSLKCECTINTSIMGIPQPSTITIYNLSEATRNSIRKGLTKVKVEAGWSNIGYNVIFTGSIINVDTNVNGVDNCTTLSCIAGYANFVSATSTFTFAENELVSNVIRKVVATLKNINIDESSLATITTKVSNGGYSFAGRTLDCLNELASLYGFSWHIENGIMYCKKDGVMLGKALKVAGQGGGLISVQPIQQGVMQITTGVKAEFYYVSGLKAGCTIEIDSKFNPKLNGKYIAHTCTTTLGTFDSTWKSEVECYKSF